MRPMLQMLGVVTTTIVLTGCASHAFRNPASAPRVQQLCDATGAKWAVGKTNTEHNVNEARVHAKAYMVRVLRSGQAATSEFNAERLSLEVDASGRIIAARCG